MNREIERALAKIGWTAQAFPEDGSLIVARVGDDGLPPLALDINTNGIDTDNPSQLRAALERAAMGLTPERIAAFEAEGEPDEVRLALERGYRAVLDAHPIEELAAAICPAATPRPPLAERAGGVAAAMGSPADYRSDPAQLEAWFDDVDAELARRARDFPACWGGMYRIGDPGLYVTEEDFDEVLPNALDRWLYMAMSNYGPYGTGEHVIEEFADVARNGGGALYEMGAGTDAVDAAVYYTEDLPDNYAPEELEELLEERPDLRSDLEPTHALDGLEAECAAAPGFAPGSNVRMGLDAANRVPGSGEHER